MYKRSRLLVFLTAFLSVSLIGFAAFPIHAFSSQNLSSQKISQLPVSQSSDSNIATAKVENLRGYSTGGITWDYSEKDAPRGEYTKGNYTPSSANVELNYRVLKNDAWSSWEHADSEMPDLKDKGASEFIVFGNVSAIEAKAESNGKISNLKINISNADSPSSLATGELTNGENAESSASSSQNSLQAAPHSVGSEKVTAGAKEPAICDRKCWGANESWMKWNPQIIKYRGVVIHHTAGSNDYTKSESAGIVRSIYAYHANTLGWGDIGYNFLVDKYGQIFEGRWLSRYNQVQGAHAYGANEYTFGVSALGNYETAQPTEALLKAFASIISWKFSVYDLDPKGKANIGTESQGVKYLPTILGHRDVGATACPGKNLYAKFADIKQLIEADYGVDGAIGIKWRALGAASGRMGFPTTAEIPDEKGVAQVFQGGNIYWKKSTGATHPTWGAIRSKYNSIGARGGVLGYPTSDELGLTRGVAQTFDSGTIYWISRTGKTFPVVGAIKSMYNSKSGTKGPIGYPKSEQMSDSKGLGQIFDKGKIFLKEGDSKAFWVHDAIANLYNRLGSRAGKLGYPISNEMNGGSYTYQKFEHGQIRWTAARDAWVVY
ncbi:MAG: N-acetylmuramoyl-L-alanine amidase [Bifidobacteriaceae bacterium]|jgi:uncharacterized protein with LGFP repeats|nr:N-acetylmuramoyl-L-alanine amidase [Bifidobacteriaceae bacterium]